MNSDHSRLAYARAVFASHLPTGSHPLQAEFAAAITDSIHRCAALGGCECLVAQEYGDHPDTAAARMRWALQLTRDLSSTSIVSATLYG
jgi:hypothetical protein